jgi:hypothetical protein
VPLPDDPLKLVGVEPLSKQEVVHHMLLFGELDPIPRPAPRGICLRRVECPPLGRQRTMPHCAGCAKPASDQSVWDCHTHSVCAEAGSHVLYGWAKGAEAMHLPLGVGFRVGQGTGTRHLVLQASARMHAAGPALAALRTMPALSVTHLHLARKRKQTNWVGNQLATHSAWNTSSGSHRCCCREAFSASVAERLPATPHHPASASPPETM